jgi:hypothetical protein
MSADPNDPVAAFAEYAADAHWVATHLGQFLGIAVLAAALVALARVMQPGRPAAWARIGVAGTSASVATAAALQAVDGVALKLAVDRWSRATGDTRMRAFEAAFAVRQVEVGLASMLSTVFGLTIAVFGVAMLAGRRFPAWLGWVGLVGGFGSIAAGIAQAYTAFSALSMNVSLSASTALLVWAVGVGVFLWRLVPELPGDAATG